MSSRTTYILPDDPDLRPIGGLSGPGSILRPGDPEGVDLGRVLDPKKPGDRVLLEAGLVLKADRRAELLRTENTRAALDEADQVVERLRRRCSILDKQVGDLQAKLAEAEETNAALVADLGEAQLNEERQREQLESMQAEIGDLRAQLDTPPWHEAGKRKVITFANKLASSAGLPRFTGRDAHGRAIAWLDDQPRRATVDEWQA